MPEYLGDILVVTEEELIPRFWNNYEALKKKLWRDEKKGFGMERAMRGDNCRKLLVKFDSLPKRMQEEIGAPRKPQHILQKYYRWIVLRSIITKMNSLIQTVSIYCRRQPQSLSLTQVY